MEYLNVDKDFIIKYTHGMCDFWAINFQRKYGGSFLVVEKPKKYKTNNEWYFIHVFVKVNNEYYDIRGKRNYEEIDNEIKTFYCEKDYILSEAQTETELANVLFGHLFDEYQEHNPYDKHDYLTDVEKNYLEILNDNYEFFYEIINCENKKSKI